MWGRSGGYDMDGPYERWENGLTAGCRMFRLDEYIFPWIYRSLRRHLITHSLHPLFSRHNRTKLQSTYTSFILPESKEAAENCLQRLWLRMCACSVPVPLRVSGTGCGVTAATVVISEQIIKSTVALSFWDHHTHHQSGKLTPGISQKLLNL